MANSPDQKPKMESAFLDRPELMETFADQIETIEMSGACVNLMFVVSRVTEIKPPNPPKRTRYPVARLVMPTEAFLQAFNKLEGFMKMLEAQGAIRRDPTTGVVPVVPQGNQKPGPIPLKHGRPIPT